MMKRNLLLLLSFLPLLLCGQVSFVVQAPQQVQANEQFQISFVLRNANGFQFTPPSLQDFQVLAGPISSQEQSFQNINGKTTSSSTQSYQYILSAKKKGSYKIGVATIRAEGKKYHTQATTLKVVGEVASPSSPTANTPLPTSSKNNRDLFFSAQVSRKKVYEQEPVMLSYRFHAQPGVGLVNVSLRQKPDMKGFWTQEIPLPRNLSPQTESINGKTYRTGTNMQFLLFPQQAGTLHIPGVTFDCEVMQQEEDWDEIESFFRGGGSLSKQLQRTTSPLQIEVLPLPSPRPTQFSGGVGQMSIRGAVIGNTPKTNEMGTYRITVKGTGNLKLIKAPTLHFPTSFDHYPPKTKEATTTTAEGLNGEIHFDYTFVPRETGKATLPAVPFVYFNTAKKQYITLHTPQLSLNIEKGERSAAEVEAELALQQSDIRDIQQGEVRPFSPRGILWIGSLPYFLLLLLILGSGCALVAYSPKLLTPWMDRTERRTRKAQSKAHQRLRSAEKLLHNQQQQPFYNAMAAAFTGYFADKFKEQPARLTHQHIEVLLREKGCSETDIQETLHLLEAIDFGRFAPTANDVAPNDVFQRAHLLLQRLEDQIQ